MRKLFLIVPLFAVVGLIACGGSSTKTVTTAPPPATTQTDPPPAVPPSTVNGWSEAEVNVLLNQFEQAGISPTAAKCIAQNVEQRYTPDEFIALSHDEAYALGQELGAICGA